MENAAQLAVEPGQQSLDWITGKINPKAANAKQSPGHALETLIGLNELNDEIKGWIKLEADDNGNEQRKII
ncbi:hypothetical protein GcM3_222039 [Golovinomyces cichoracearum]|uniref:Uncharacterized protein n=1 Tax=Golovinomyces cichoracearum TaxID=62708 RepID=A0A420H1P7_9PEZI|nr:hypothetical protein GcM3_222039 [Golovinomyces cichoracearum]